MIRIGSEFIFWSVAFFVVMLIFDGFDIALQSTMFIIGMIYYTYNIAFVYLRLKKVCFNFVSIRLRTTCIFDSKLKATCSSWPKLGQVDSTWVVLPTCLAGVHGGLHGYSRSRVSGVGHPPSIHVD